MYIANHNSKKQGWLAFLLLLPILIAAAVVGFFVFVVILGLILFAATVLMLRLWWLRRSLRKAAEGSQTLNAEYVVIRAPAMDGGSAEREAVPTETNAGADFPKSTPHDDNPPR